jgi:hypothetical protein
MKNSLGLWFWPQQRNIYVGEQFERRNRDTTTASAGISTDHRGGMAL